MFGILKETKLMCLKYIALNKEYFINEGVDLHLTKAALKRALKAMINLIEIIVVCNITIRRLNYDSIRRI